MMRTCPTPSRLTDCRRWRTGTHALSVLVVLPLVGCGSSDDVTLVQGEVTYEGAAVTSGLINFLPSGGKPLGGPIDHDGTFAFELPPGEFQVRIDTPERVPAGWKEGDPPPEMAPRQVPASYASFSTSGLTATVKRQSGPQQVDFELP